MDSRNVIQYTINDFINWQEHEELVLVPYFQRRDVWASKAKSSLIDTVLRDLPIPGIIIRQSINPKTGKTIREVVDGQQRLRSIFEFYNNQIPILRAHNKELAGLKFKDLSQTLQSKFRDYMFSVNVLRGASDPEILDIFGRLNSYTLTLNKQEKLNAKYHGEFKTFIYRESSKYLDFFRERRILSNARIIRMAEAELFSELIVAMIDGLQHGKKTIEDYYKKYDDEFPQADELKEKFSSIVSLIDDILGGKIRSTIYRKSNLFYSLFCVVYDLVYGMKRQDVPQGITIPATKYPTIVNHLNLLSEQAEAEAPDSSYVEFKLACTGHVDNLKERTTRHKYVKSAIFQELE